MGELLTRSVGSLATSPRAKGIGYTLEVQRRIRERVFSGTGSNPSRAGTKRTSQRAKPRAVLHDEGMIAVTEYSPVPA